MNLIEIPGNVKRPEAGDISIRFENCRVTSKKGSGIVVGGVRSDGPNGLIEIVEFIDCLLEDDRNRPFLAARERDSNLGVYDIAGTITVRNPHGAFMDLGSKTHDATLKVKAHESLLNNHIEVSQTNSYER